MTFTRFFTPLWAPFCLLSTAANFSTLSASPLPEQGLRNLEHHAHGKHQLTPELTLNSDTEQKPPLSLLVELGWESAYVSEGLKAFESGGIYVFQTEAHFHGLILSVWHGQSDRQKLSESKFLLGYEYNFLENFTLTPSYEYALTSPDHVGAHTPALNLSYALTDTYTLGMDCQWDAQKVNWRAYYDLYVEGSWELTEKLSLSLSLLYAYNDGFLREGFAHGSNSLDYSATLNYQLDESWCFVVSLNYSQALTSLRQGSGVDEETGIKTTLGDVFWIGTHLHYEF